MTDKPTTEPKTIAGLPVLTVAEKTEKLNVLIYGDPGSGKTTLAASAWEVPDMRPVLIVDVEGGTKSVKTKYPKVNVVRIKTHYDQKGRVVKSAWDSLEELYEILKKGEGEYKTIILDSLSEIYWIYMAHWMDSVVAEHPDRDPDVPAQRDWGKASARIKSIVRRYRDLDRHVIFTALKGAVTNDDGMVLNYTPAFPGKLAYESAAFVDEVYYLYTKTDKDVTSRVILTENAKKYLAKSRNGMPQTVEDPTMGKIAEMVLDKEEAK